MEYYELPIELRISILEYSYTPYADGEYYGVESRQTYRKNNAEGFNYECRFFC